MGRPCRRVPVLPVSAALSFGVLSGCGGSAASKTAAAAPAGSAGATSASPSAQPTNAAPSPANSRAAVVSIRNFAYRPTTVSVGVGASVTFSNRDSTNHTVTADRGTFDLGNLDQGQSKTFKFSKAGTYTYHCSYHPFMHGTVVVK